MSITDTVALAIYAEFDSGTYVGPYEHGRLTCLDGYFDLNDIAEAAIEAVLLVIARSDTESFADVMALLRSGLTEDK